MAPYPAPAGAHEHAQINLLQFNSCTALHTYFANGFQTSATFIASPATFALCHSHAVLMIARFGGNPISVARSRHVTLQPCVLGTARLAVSRAAAGVACTL